MLRTIASLSVALALTACPDKGSETESDSQGSGTGGSSSTTVEPTTGGTGDTGTTAGGMSEGMSETTAEPGTTTTEPNPTTGGGSEDLMASCMAACGHIFECVQGLPGTIDDCMAGCIDQWGGPECGQAGLDFLDCLIGMNCKQVQGYIEDDEPGMCAAAAEAADAVCDGGGGQICEMSGGGGQGECSVSRDCGDGVEEFACDGELCTCIVDGVPGESCMDTGVCDLDIDAQGAAAEACCGWVWS